jgi:hypothetical protein
VSLPAAPATMRLLTPAAEVRSWRAVPPVVIAFGAALLAARVVLTGLAPVVSESRVQDLPPVPSAATLSLAGLGDRAVLGAGLLLWLQAFDSQGGRHLSYRDLDYGRLIEWLDRIHELRPDSDYPLLLATRVYSSTPDREQMRSALEFTHRTALSDPERFWRWLAEAAVLAKHRLGDLSLGLQMARDITRRVPAGQLPHWARDLELILLQDLGEYESAYLLIQGLLDSGEITDPDELRFLRHRLEALRRRLVDK